MPVFGLSWAGLAVWQETTMLETAITLESAMRPRRSAPAEEPRICVGSFPGRLDQVSQARAFAAAFLDGWPRADDAMLLIGELCANAVLHTQSGWPGGMFTVRAMMAGNGLRAEVQDQGSGWDGRLNAAQCPHGLFLLRQVATTCGTRRSPSGWTIWFTLGHPGAPTWRPFPAE
jgi:anti-sigma regulatory factor (Ser/Thr protein kinase)